MNTKRPSLPKTIWILGFVSLLMDMSSEMVHGLLPVFLVSALGASYATVGFIEGFGESAAVAMKVVSGPLSDWLGKRKGLVLLGYGMAALSKPLFAIASSSGMVLGARVFDRIGKGIRGAPRDALIADVTPPEIRGAAFGLRQSLDTVGAVLGPLLAMLIMYFSANNFRLVFGLSVVPALLCVFLILTGIQEPDVLQKTQGRKILSGFRKFGTSFWIVAVAGALSQLARFSEAFLILRAQNLGLRLSLVPMVLVAMNVVFSLSAYPIGWISDRWSRESLMVIGFLILSLADLCLAFSSNLAFTFVGILLWGLHLGFTQGTLAALVVDHCSTELRGTAFGLFNLLSAFALLIASVTAGLVWDQYGAQTTFLIGALVSVLSPLIFLFTKRIWKASPT